LIEQLSQRCGALYRGNKGNTRLRGYVAAFPALAVPGFDTGSFGTQSWHRSEQRIGSKPVCGALYHDLRNVDNMSRSFLVGDRYTDIVLGLSRQLLIESEFAK
jgi:hypothetical protein